ncbi:MAG: PLP-dependent aminotransferase family protein [Synergistaceae bacterium]|nr:PLP-dependent aminotransferase family protein [Synergistaceae bacterium]
MSDRGASSAGGFEFRDQMSSMARERLGTTGIGEMISLVVENGAMSFGAGEPSSDMFPVDLMRDAMERAFCDPDIWGYHHDDFGSIELREWIASRMKQDGIAPDWVGPENILLTNGGGEAISLVTEALIDPGSLILVESPTYTESLLTFRKQGAVCVPVQSDDEGIIPSELERIVSARRARFLYTIPNFQNPSGRTTPAERRMRILDILRENDVALVEDDPYHYLSYDGPPPPSYLKMARDDRRVIHTNSFSKIIAPGLRAGWVVIPPALVKTLSSLRVSAGLGRPLAIQKGILFYMQGIDFERTIAGLCGEYRRRRGVMLDLIAKHLTPMGFCTNRPAGGFFIWGSAPGEADVKEFAHYAVREERIGIIPGSAFYPDGEHGGDGSFRLSYSKVGTDAMEEGMIRLARAWRSYVGAERSKA